MAAENQASQQALQKQTDQRNATEHHERAYEHYMEAVKRSQFGDKNAAAYNLRSEAYHAKLAREHAAKVTETDMRTSKRNVSAATNATMPGFSQVVL